MGSSIFVAPDPQFSVARILRPYPEAASGGSPSTADYQGQSVLKPILLTEGGKSADPLAGTPGYATNLVAGTHTPMGARCLFWLPVISTSPPAATEYYMYTIYWRLRNLEDYLRSKGQYHFPFNSEISNLVVKPAAFQTIQYNQAEPTVVGDPGQANLKALQLNQDYPLTIDKSFMRTNTNTLAIARVAQGSLISDNIPGYMIYECRAVGDEVLIGITRTDAAGANWDFDDGTGADRQIPLLFNNVNDPDKVLGAYLFVGIAP